MKGIWRLKPHLRWLQLRYVLRFWMDHTTTTLTVPTARTWVRSATGHVVYARRTIYHGSCVPVMHASSGA